MKTIKPQKSALPANAKLSAMPAQTKNPVIPAHTQNPVIPAQAGIHFKNNQRSGQHGFPPPTKAFEGKHCAGMTNHGENAERRDKSRPTFRAATLVLALAAAFALPSHPAHAAPQGGQVVAGQATIAQPNANTTTITQSTQKAIIDWQSFSIAANQHTQFIQPSAASVTLNRVVGVDPSQILGRLTANGQVFLVNPNGIYFGKNAQIDVAGLIATTHNIRNADFLAGNYTFNIAGKAGAAVINDGMIHIADTGIAAFVAPSVANRGVIVARLGKVMLASANGFTLDFSGDQLISFLVNDQVAQTAFDLQGTPLTSFVENAGQIQAQGGYVLLTAKAAENAIHSVINQTGSIEATTVGTHNGTIILNAGTGSLNVAGTLDASAPTGGDGCYIDTSGAHVKFNPNAKITTAAPLGKTGTWLIDPVDFTIAATGGDITGAQLAARLANSNIEIQTLPTGTGNGDIFVNDAVTWGSFNELILTAHRNVNVNSLINATGGGSVRLRADSLGTGVGTVNFAGTGHVNANNGAAVGIYYNPVSYTDALTKSDATGNPYSNNVTLGAGAAGMTAYMLVNDVNKLQAVNTNLSGNYALGKNIDATATATWNAGAGFLPIGGAFATRTNPTASPVFSGLFSGQGYRINGLTINHTGASAADVGLFARSSGALHDVSITNANVSSNTGSYTSLIGPAPSTGILVGSNNGGNIWNVFTSGLVSNMSVGWGSTGGLVGTNDVGVINNAGVISRSGSSANVQATSIAGGLAGTSKGVVQDSYATGNLSQSRSTVGGLVGQNTGNILRSYATGKITPALGATTGGLLGWDTSSTNSLLNNYWDTTTSALSVSTGGTGWFGLATPASGTGLTTAQMQQQTNFTGWDFVNTWQIAPNGYPTLKAFTPQPTTPIITPTVGGGPGVVNVNNAVAVQPGPSPVPPPVTPPVTPPITPPVGPVAPKPPTMPAGIIPSLTFNINQWQPQQTNPVAKAVSTEKCTLGVFCGNGKFSDLQITNDESSALTRVGSTMPVGKPDDVIDHGFVEHYLEIKRKEAKDSLPYAALANLIYTAASNEDWELLPDGYKEKDSSSGFNAGVYKNKHTGQIVVAFGGTTAIAPTQLNNDEVTAREVADFITDVCLANPTGKATQLSDAADFIHYAKEKYGNVSAVTGHSLGGGLAQYIALKEGIPAITFNSAPLALSVDVRKELGVLNTESVNEKRIVNYRSVGDPLTSITMYIEKNPEFGKRVLKLLPEAVSSSNNFLNSNRGSVLVQMLKQTNVGKILLISTPKQMRKYAQTAQRVVSESGISSVEKLSDDSEYWEQMKKMNFGEMVDVIHTENIGHSMDRLLDTIKAQSNP